MSHRPSRILVVYLVREVLVYAFLGTAAIFVVFLAANLRHFLDELIGVGFAATDLLPLLRCLLGMVAPYVVPIAFMFGVLLAMGRKSSDREVLAMQACGLGFSNLLLPVLLLGAVISGVTWYLTLQVEHQARRDLRLLTISLATRAARFPPGQFSVLGPRVVYVQDSDEAGRLQGVMISDRSDARALMIFAEYGRFGFRDDQSRFEFRLENGDIHVEPSEDQELYQHISFRTLDYDFDVSNLFRVPSSAYRRYDMTLAELHSLLARAAAGDPLLDSNSREGPNDYAFEIHRRYALPAAPMLFALVSVPLGLRPRRGARAWGVLFSFVLAFGYYTVLTFNQNLAHEGVLAPSIAVWMPNLTFALLAAALLYATRRREI